MEINKQKMEDLLVHQHHELTLEYIYGIGLVLRCLDCKQNIFFFEDKK